MSLIQEIDYGTPRSKSETTVTLTIDGQSVTVPEGTSIMRAAMEAGTADPEALRHRHAGRVRLLPPVPGRDRGPRRHAGLLHHAGEPGMVVHTQTERLKKLRKGVMELYISDHPLDCLTCAANGDCELQDMAGAVGLREVRYGYEGENHSSPSPMAAKRLDAEGRVQSRISPSIPPNASSARAACAPARKCRAPSR